MTDRAASPAAANVGWPMRPDSSESNRASVFRPKAISSHRTRCSSFATASSRRAGVRAVVPAVAGSNPVAHPQEIAANEHIYAEVLSGATNGEVPMRCQFLGADRGPASNSQARSQAASRNP